MTINPHIIQSNNGTEFKNYNSIDWYEENKIKFIFTLSYAPKLNGAIKHFYNQLRKVFREVFK